MKILFWINRKHSLANGVLPRLYGAGLQNLNQVIVQEYTWENILKCLGIFLTLRNVSALLKDPPHNEVYVVLNQALAKYSQVTLLFAI